MINLLLTTDYEIFGNGTGDVRCCLINPTDRLLDLCDRYGARLTLFFEVCEYWAFKQGSEEGKLDHLDYDPAAEMEAQAKDALERGHDVQLHVHPQWLNASLEDDGTWKLNYQWWRVPDLPHDLGDFDDVLSLRGLLRKGKDTLEEMLRPVKADYLCIAVRAGSLCVQPESEVFHAMREVALLIDSSASVGGVRDALPIRYDFRRMPSQGEPFQTFSSLEKMVPDGDIIEAPIFAARRPRLLERGFRRLLRICSDSRPWKQSSPVGCSGYTQQLSKDLTPIKSRDVMVNFEFSVLNAEDMRWLVRTAAKQCSSLPNGNIWIVAIGHSKFFGDETELDRFLRWTAHRQDIRTDRTFSDMLAQFIQR